MTSVAAAAAAATATSTAAAGKATSQPQRGMNSVITSNISAACGPTASSSSSTPSPHAPSAVGSVLEASDGVGGKCYIRLQNIAATSKEDKIMYWFKCLVHIYS